MVSFMLKHSLFFLTVFIVCTTIDFSQSTQPILRMNMEMHTSTIAKLSADRSGKFILTCSKDKTGKLWDLKTGDLIRTFRTPQSEGNEGMLYACAISPDGKTALFGGSTGYIWERSSSVYIFDTQTGEMTGKIKGFDNIITGLEYSPDGNNIAVCFRGGVKIIDSRTKTVRKFLSTTNSDCFNAVFDSEGRLAIPSFDGRVQLFDKNFSKLAEAKLTGGKQPYSISFSPDGSKIAIGYDDDDSLKLQVLDGKNLKLLFEPSIKNAESKENKLEMVAFSNDGKYLFAAGNYSRAFDGKVWKALRRYNNAGKGEYTDFKLCVDNVMDLKTVNDNSIIFSTTYPEFGRITTDGYRTIYKKADLCDFRILENPNLHVDSKGSKIEFTPKNSTPIIFSIPTREFLIKGSDWKSPSAKADGIEITEWNNSSNPKINGKSVGFMNDYERCHSVDIIPAKKQIVFGTSWKIYCTDYSGLKYWEVPVQGGVWCVNVTGDGKSIIASSDDGMMRWYRLSDGKQFLSLYMHPDKQRWVLWTPSGYYDCSAGAEELIGWHVGNGLDKEGEFYPISRFRSTYLKPDLIDKVFDTGDEQEALKPAEGESKKTFVETDISKKLPPIINIVTPMTGFETSKTTVGVSYTVKSSNDAPITAVRILVNGRPLNSRGMKPISGNEQVDVLIPQEDCTISLLAENKNGVSEPSTISVKWTAGAGTKEFVSKPTLYLLSVGVSNYKDAALKLNYAAKDAGDIVNAFTAQKGLLYRDVKVKLLTDSAASRDNIIDGLDWIQKETTAKDVAIVFLGGHGMNDNWGTFYYLPYDANTDKIKRTCVMFEEVKKTVSSVVGKMILFTDACHSGNIMGGNRKAVDINSLVNDLTSAENGAIVFTSSTGKQYSLEKEEWKNGAFTKAVIEGLNGEAAYDGKITIKSLDFYIGERVKKLTGGQQSPVTIIPVSIPDFPIAVKK